MNERKVITVDYDDVIQPSTEHFVRIYNKLHGTNVELEFAQTSGYEGWETGYDTIGERIYAIQSGEEFAEIEPYPDAIETIGLLAEKHDLHIVTARPEQLMAVTAFKLDKYFPGIFKSVVYTGHGGSKGKIAKSLGAEIHIDDALKHLKDTASHEVKHSILFGNYPWHTHGPDAVQLYRCANWYDVHREVALISESKAN